MEPEIGMVISMICTYVQAMMLQKQISRLDKELQQKDNDAYRREHAEKSEWAITEHEKCVSRWDAFFVA